jgi:hypothetical protein
MPIEFRERILPARFTARLSRHHAQDSNNEENLDRVAVKESDVEVGDD